eukprot:1151810-Pelagomonas_calceolata.AAC.6
MMSCLDATSQCISAVAVLFLLNKLAIRALCLLMCSCLRVLGRTSRHKRSDCPFATAHVLPGDLPHLLMRSCLRVLGLTGRHKRCNCSCAARAFAAPAHALLPPGAWPNWPAQLLMHCPDICSTCLCAPACRFWAWPGRPR